jgi:hypothetical protein
MGLSELSTARLQQPRKRGSWLDPKCKMDNKPSTTVFWNDDDGKLGSYYLLSTTRVALSMWEGYETHRESMICTGVVVGEMPRQKLKMSCS